MDNFYSTETFKFSKNLQDYIKGTDYQYSGIDNNSESFNITFNDTTITASKYSDTTWKVNIHHNNILSLISRCIIDRKVTFQQVFVKDEDLKFLYNLPIRHNKEII